MENCRSWSVIYVNNDKNRLFTLHEYPPLWLLDSLKGMSTRKWGRDRTYVGCLLLSSGQRFPLAHNAFTKQLWRKLVKSNRQPFILCGKIVTRTAVWVIKRVCPERCSLLKSPQFSHMKRFHQVFPTLVQGKYRLLQYQILPAGSVAGKTCNDKSSLKEK